MISIIISSNIFGVDSFDVSVETDITKGIPSFSIVGLPGTEIKEARERVKSAIINSGYRFPNSRIVVNLSPADVKKQGSFLDFPIALGIMRGNIRKSVEYINESIFVGELSLDGNLKRIRGILPIVIGSMERGFKRIFIPEDNYSECMFVEGIDIIPIKTLKESMDFLNGIIKYEHIEERRGKIYRISKEKQSYESLDFSDIKGNTFLKRCAEVAAAGGHNMLMIGPPGSGKSFMAKRIPGIMPSMDESEMIEVSKIYSVYGSGNGLIKRRPFRSPHHTSTEIAIIGGGADARAGEITMAHLGVLFLDEVAEFDRKTLEALRQPIEDRKVDISRSRYSISYPSDFMLVAAMNPCPCGYSGSDRECRCRTYEIERYRGKLSGPLLDRIDIFVEVNSITFEEMNNLSEGETSEDIRKRVESARKIQKKRFGNNKITNRSMSGRDIDKYCRMDKNAQAAMKLIFDKYRLSNRAYTRIMALARTISDIENREVISESDILEAFSMRRVYYKYFEKNYI
ncbi:ATP-binding protein [Peptacetobacter hominis]|uniref:ATP-binding protein n=1 Tax=Peptacetobacter hominis TaxID=2743610 RepID=A0A544QVB7_9FIRM|nr:YifB family Mg chelatase-like AAA ATPase [Peptacetobacter hominis]TQQ84616.1 ATP-binding protein [Peptacetobacter hominis]